MDGPGGFLKKFAGGSLISQLRACPNGTSFGPSRLLSVTRGRGAATEGRPYDL